MNKKLRIKKHKTIRKHLGKINRPRFSVFRSSQHIYAQIIDDTIGQTLASESDLKDKGINKSQRAKEVGKRLAEKAKKLKIIEVVFDRGGFLYHGRIMKLAMGAREGGLKF